MPHLYCEQHGKEHEAHVIGQASTYRQEGETILIVKGKLISGGWPCDRCNAPLGKGDPAYLLTVFPRWITEQISDYDFIHERQYFAIRGPRSPFTGPNGRAAPRPPFAEAIVGC